MGKHIWIGAVAVLAIISAIWAMSRSDAPAQAAESGSTSVDAAESGDFPVVIRQTEARPIIQLEVGGGERVDVRCSTCHIPAHSGDPAAPLRATVPLGAGVPNSKAGGDQLPERFHSGLALQHGDLRCLSCHSRDNYDALTLAHGEQVAFSDAMRLCAQCHGPQVRDYTNGSHGGMTGYWDLSRGPRERNACTHCHHPHHPAFPTVMPAPGPNDRFLRDGEHEEGGNPHE